MIRITTKYHRLFEVRLLHEYFLLGENQLEFFTETQVQRTALLQKRVHDGNYKIADNLEIVPTKETAELLKNYRLKFKQTGIGMIVGSEGKTDEFGITMPNISIGDDVEMNFKIQVVDPIFKNYTLLPFKNNTQGNYLFSNTGQPLKSTDFSSLSQPVPEFVSGKLYVAGELTEQSGNLREAEANTDNSANWQTIGGAGYVNENDRRHFPKSFTYFPEDGQGNYVFELEDDSNFILKRIEKTVSDNETIRLDFSRTGSPGSREVQMPDGLFKLKISTPLNDEEQMVFLSDEYRASDFGMINIRMRPEDLDYRILELDGSIRTNPHPVFEIRMRSRRTFWRYRPQNQTKRLKPTTTIDAGFFTDENNMPATINQPTKFLITKIPQKMARLPVQIMKPGGNMEFFPQPRPSPFRQKRPNELLPNNEPPGRIYSDIYITTINGKIDVVN